MTSIRTSCVHAGAVADAEMGLAPALYPSTTYRYLELADDVYPRHSNTPNQRALCEKVCALEQTEAAAAFSSGMAAISTSLLALLRSGDHLVVQRGVYRGAFQFISKELERAGVTWSETPGLDADAFASVIRRETRAIFIESPTNPRLAITDIAEIAGLARARGLITMIDNTLATPVNQQPASLGVDLVFHSATKFLGGHGDLCGGLVAGRANLVERVRELSNTLGGCMAPQVCHLLQRSLLTLAVRLERINRNANNLAVLLEEHRLVDDVFYPGLPNHPGHQIASRQMSGFGGVLAFNLSAEVDAVEFQRNLQVIHVGNSLGEVFTSVSSPVLASTSIGKLSEKEQLALGVSRQLVRMSVGIEDLGDLSADLVQALERSCDASARQSWDESIQRAAV